MNKIKFVDEDMNAHDLPRREISLIGAPPMEGLTEIKLLRTDTTLDLSQKAEKGIPHFYERGRIYNMDFIISAIPVYGLNVFELRLLLLRSLYVFRIDCGGP